MLAKFFSNFIFLLLLLGAANSVAAATEYQTQLSNSIEQELIHSFIIL